MDSLLELMSSSGISSMSVSLCHFFSSFRWREGKENAWCIWDGSLEKLWERAKYESSCIRQKCFLQGKRLTKKIRAARKSPHPVTFLMARPL